MPKKRKKKPYKHPIPSRNELLTFLEKKGKPMRINKILDEFELKGQRMRSLLEDRLYGMVRAGQIMENRRGEFCLMAKLDLVTGVVTGHRDGFGFVVRDDGGDDVYLSAREMRPLFDGDRVAVKIIGVDRRGKPEGDLVEVLERGIREVAIIRVEQLYPFPREIFKTVIKRYGRVKKVIWCQEEPQNQGAWDQTKHRLYGLLKNGNKLYYAGRAVAAAPAVGYHQLHLEQQERFIDVALTGDIDPHMNRGIIN